MKVCDLCGKNEAVLPVKQLDKEGKAVRLMVCGECAKRRGFSDVEKKKSDGSDQSGFSKGNIAAGVKVKIGDQDKNIVCPSCGMSFVEFKRRGRLGCANCYNTFPQELQRIIRRIHGSVQHVGKSPNQGRKRAQERLQVQRLRAELDVAIKEEDYERAAALRDLLKQTGNEADT